MDVTREQLEEVLMDAGLDPNLTSDVRWDYSGRFMYGRTCLGIVGTHQHLVALAVEVGRRIEWGNQDVDWEYLSRRLVDVRVDSLGTDSIFYWPDVQVVEAIREDPDPDHVLDVALDAELGVG